MSLRLLKSFVVIALLLAGAAHAQERVVNVYNWSDYIDPKVIEEFTKETGIKVRYDTFDSNEIVEAKLLAGLDVREQELDERLLGEEGVTDRQTAGFELLRDVL